MSKAGGTPRALPDFIALAIRVTPQQEAATPSDILFVSAGAGVLGRAVALRPVPSWTGQTLTTRMPLRYWGNKLRYWGNNWWLRARIVSEINGFGLSLDNVRRRIEHGGIAVAFDQARGGADLEELA